MYFISQNQEEKQNQEKTEFRNQGNFFSRFFSRRLSFLWWSLIILGIFLGSLFLIWKNFQKVFLVFEEKTPLVRITPKIEKEKEKQKNESLAPPLYVYAPVEISMKDIKTKGCVADGLLSGYGNDTQEAVAMINRSKCLYLHRALETWLAPPDFSKAAEIMQKIKSKKLVFGMFLAEAIDKKAIYYYPEEKRFFDFKTMCREGSENFWGEHTCKPSFSSGEYRKYLKFITRRAMDLGIQSFLFGQIYYQDSADLNESRAPEIIEEMKEYARKKDMEIIVGAQTGNITNEDYLKLFDYIEGGLGIGDDGRVEEGPCWSELQTCWALLWHENYSQKARNVLVHFDWSGLEFDDMSAFARMESVKRAEVLNRLRRYFAKKNVGFLMPLMTTLFKENQGCFGPSEGFYSASKAYNCKDEDVINLLLK